MQKINNMSKIISGKNSVIDAIENKLNIIKIISTKKPNFDTKNIVIEIQSKEYLDSLTNSNHQGIIAIISSFEYYSLESIIKQRPEVVLILDHIEDVHNFGAIIRTANASGINHIIIPDKRSVQINDVVLKVSSGGFVNMKIAKVSSLQPVIEKLKKINYWIYSTSLDEQSVDYTSINYNFPLAIVVGNESKGISKTILKASDQIVSIPMYGTVQSLNVSVATGILLFDIIKKLKK